MAKQATHHSLARVITIDRHVRNEEYPSIERLMQELEVSRRLILYDLEYLRDQMQAPLAYDRRRKGYYYTEPTYMLPNIAITAGELMAFFLSIEVAQRFLGTPFEAPLREAVRKLSREVQGDVRVDLDEMRRHYTFSAPALPSVNPQLLTDLTNAIRQKRQVRIVYHSAHSNETTERSVDPYHLSNITGDWVLIGFDHLRDDWRDFLLARVSHWEVLPRRFERVSFDAEAYMGPAFRYQHGGEPQCVEIRFDEYQARWIRERRWHDTQEPLEETPDGGVILRFRSAGLEEVKRWVLQYGRHARVLAPEELRQMVSMELTEAAKMYESKSGPREAKG
jgi:predicted DNA-binding transcriptional regulator YafY